MPPVDPEYSLKLTQEQVKARKKRNLVLALIIVAFMALVFTITVVRLQEGVARQAWTSATETSGWETAPGIQSGEGAPPEPSTESGDE
ncbi:hypothetical protein [Ponticaulis sp.]|uniref:hypothetical protein n=1 Tax=Ponticaulis sp. TaxID=2020902 RepID=UPI000B720473|nr:hypothetical protein [Ponticaulis sp.]MAI90843.1 hypothetical protein [Ponticaulis sp.]OUX98818.1 MAG: hypothetical protein CBB65_10405 [Hyphomonadaceae bacterium TMED5]|tara:strand:- start:3928 stop:4191 length:264 start_codon:yes stop_codon:yes gene_type:complete